MRCIDYADFRIIQFNDLPLNGSITPWSYDQSFRLNNTQKSFSHGDYLPSEKNYLNAMNVTLTCDFDLKKLRKGEERQFIEFIKENFSVGGLLWATYGNELVYTHATPSSIGFSERVYRNRYVFSVDLFCKNGYWEKADNHSTFLSEYKQCDFSLCRKYMDYKVCYSSTGLSGCNCWNGCGNPYGDDRGICATCNCNCNLSVADSLCKRQMDERTLYKDMCNNKYKIHIDCYLGKEIFDFDFYGERFCREEGSSLIGGYFFSSTTIDTNATFTLVGKFTNPEIEVNGYKTTIQGDFDGLLQVTGNKAAYYRKDGNDFTYCNDLIASTNNFEQIKPQGNTFVVTGLDCCGSMACVFIKTNDRTI